MASMRTVYVIIGAILSVSILFTIGTVAAGNFDNSQHNSNASVDGTSIAAGRLKFQTQKHGPSNRVIENALLGISLKKMVRRNSQYVENLPDGRQVTFTMQPELQKFADQLFERYRIPAGAAVILNSKTGKVLSFTQHRRNPEYSPKSSVALDPSPPAASLFKIVTLAALLEKGNVTPSMKNCYSGGGSKLLMRHLREPSIGNRACVTLTAAIGKSINAVFARLSDARLDKTILEQYADRFGFNRSIPFDVPIEPSRAEIPTDRLERARTAAGFWHTHLSPLHAALIFQSLAQNGAMLKPYIVESVKDSDGTLIYKSKPQYMGHTVKKETALALINALKSTVNRGTARKAFHDRRGVSYLPGVEVAGKTGTLTGSRPYRAYTWFAGVAPADDPEIAISVLVVNEPRWRIKASGIASQLLARYFKLESQTALRL
jgi:peptidoglycan glycosyltransferase